MIANVVFERDGWVCCRCGKPVDRELDHPHPEAGTLDHVIPIHAGGSHDPGNVRLAHRICNQRAPRKRAIR